MTDPGHPQPVTPAAPDLQFDRVQSSTDDANGATESDSAGIPCAACGSIMHDEYYSIGGKAICGNCRASVEKVRATSRTPKAFGKAFLFGLGGALAGAAVYYAVFEGLGWQLSLVTIFIGWMIGRAIQKALPGGGSRRYQVLATVLTYFAVALAYGAIGVHESWKESAATKQDTMAAAAAPGTQDSTAVVAQQGKPAASSSAADADGREPARKDGRSAPLRLARLIALVLSLPVMVVFGSGDFLAGLIIAIGMYQAWRMSGAPALAINGPYRVGANAPAATA